MTVTEAIYGRRAIRDYDEQSIDEDVLGALIEAAIQAPSALDAQPWAFIVVRDPVLLDDLSTGAIAYLRETTPPTGTRDPHAPVVDAHFHLFYHAPALIVIAATAPGAFIVEDCALAAQNLMLAAHERGLGSCFIGSAQGYLNTAQVKHELSMPAAWVCVAPIVVGHARSSALRAPLRDPLVVWVG